jgi:outer membrane protein insertion porin family
MRKPASFALALIAAGAASLHAQEPTPGVCATPEHIVVTGNARVDTGAVRGSSGLSTGTQLAVHDIQSAIKSLYATGQFDDVQIVCRIDQATSKATLTIQVRERPILTDYKIIGANRVSPKDVKEKLAFATGSPVDPGKIAKAIASVDSFMRPKATTWPA